jgi:hypothetical protein
MKAKLSNPTKSKFEHTFFFLQLQCFQKAMSQPIKIDVADKSKLMSPTNQNQFRIFRNGSRIFGNHVALLEMMSCHHDFLALEKNIKPRPSSVCFFFFFFFLFKNFTF